MGRYLVKVSPKENLYAEFSSIVDCILYTGDRNYFLSNSWSEEEITEADKYGSTWRSIGGWDDSGFIWAQFGWLAREDLGRLIQLFNQNGSTGLSIDDPKILALLGPLDESPQT